MKKNYFMIVTLLLFSIVALSQPIITYDGNCPQIGDRYDLALFTGNIAPGSAGANQSWDFSGVTSDGTSILYAIDPAQTPYNDYYPNANIAFNYNNEDAYSYGRTSPSELLNLGTASIQNSMEVIIYYSDPAKLMEFPFAFNDTYDDTYYGSFSSGTLEVHQSGTITTMADGWGSIITPYTTYNSVLRVKNQRTQIDSAWMNGNFVYTSTTTHTDFEWYAPDIAMPVFSIDISENAGVRDTTGTYLTTPQGVTEADNKTPGIIVFPNPATDHAYVLFKTDNNTSSVIITITDLSGREMTRFTKDISSAGTQNIKLSIKDLKTGIYFVNIINGREVRSHKLIIR
jgi:hypothetical protein